MSFQGSFTTLKIAAGKTEPVNAEGNNFHVVFAPVPIEVRWANGGEFGFYEQGAGVRDIPGGQTFRRLEVRNPTVGDITVVIYVGGPIYSDARSSVIEPRTEYDAWTGTQINAATGQTFSGVPSGSRIRRKAIQITNLDATLNLQVRDSAGHVGLIVFPETSITLPISEAVEIYNANGAAVACAVSEIFWTL